MRTACINRTTKETDILVRLTLDGSSKSDISTGVGFFDHMLTSFCFHGGFDLEIRCRGDLHVDCHHTVEDVGIALGQAFSQALGDKRGIRRFCHAYVPMDEALARAVVDISSRPFLVFDAAFTSPAIGTMDTQTVEEFWRAFAFNAGLTLHLEALYGTNDHHMCEALFKAAALAISGAVEQRGGDIRSTKGVL